MRGPAPAAEAGALSLAIRNAKVYPTPDSAPISKGSVLVRDGRIVQVGPDEIAAPAARELSAEGCTVVAGFWNAHVHFTEPKWKSSARKPPDILNGQLRDMLTSRGFTTAVDTGSDPRVTIPLRQRIRSGKLLGPTVYTSGTGVYPPRGIPYYLRGTIPFWAYGFIPQPSTPTAAARFVEKNVAGGRDLLKLFTGSYVARGKVTTMPEPVARAAVMAAHAHGQIVYSHPSNLEGTRVAMRSGVDVLAHPPDTAQGVDRAVIQEMVDRQMGMTPTLKMFQDTVSSNDAYLGPIHEVVRQFRELGGQLLFGTDVGYMTDYATEGEFRALARTGLDTRGILRMLTTAPALRFGVGKEVGTVTAGARADLVVLEGDPIEDLRAFARVRATVRAGQILYENPSLEPEAA